MSSTAVKKSVVNRPISFGKYVFANLKDCSQECRDRISLYSKGDVLSKADQQFFEQLFTLHPQYNKKKGVGIKNIKYDFDGLQHNCLWLVRIDGSEEHISWRKCVRPNTHKEAVSIAFKRAVCTNIHRTSKYAIEEDNSQQKNFDFNRVLNKFLKDNKINYKQVVLKHLAVGSDPRPSLLDNWLAAEWYMFHNENAQLSA